MALSKGCSLKVKPIEKQGWRLNFWPKIEQAEEKRSSSRRGVVVERVKRSSIVEMEFDRWFDRG